jgi:hypothetical protein
VNVFGKWGPLLQGLGALVGLFFFAHRARLLWKERKRRQLLARRTRRRDEPSD